MSTSQPADRALTEAIAGARAGDPDALGVVYTRYHGDVRRYVQGILGDGHEADDVVQQVFLRLGDALRCYEERSPAFAAWLLRVARNAALDRLRARAALPLDDLAAVASGVSSDETTLERRACLRQALAGLPDDQRTVVLMRHVVGLSTPEIAIALGRTEGSVAALHHRGRAGLRRRLGELGAAPAVLR